MERERTSPCNTSSDAAGAPPSSDPRSLVGHRITLSSSTADGNGPTALPKRATGGPLTEAFRFTEALPYPLGDPGHQCPLQKVQNKKEHRMLPSDAPGLYPPPGTRQTAVVCLAYCSTWYAGATQTAAPPACGAAPAAPGAK